MITAIIKAQNVTRTFGTKTNPTEVLKGINLKINKGQFVVMLGRSGSGKSTLLNQMCGLDKPTSGILMVNDNNLSSLSRAELSKYRSKIGIIFQSYNLLPNLTTIENIQMGSWSGGNNGGKEKAMEVMTKLGIEHRANQNITKLSGGEKQRVAIARALMSDPEILFCDEPTGALDRESEKQVFKILQSLNKDDGITMVVVTHNPEFRTIADQVFELEDGVVKL